MTQPTPARETPSSESAPAVILSPDDRLEPVVSKPIEAVPVEKKAAHGGLHLPRWSSRYSRFVSLAKVVFPATALVLAVAVVLWPHMQKMSEETFSISFANVGEVARESQQLVNARYFGTDDKNQAYSVTADLAQETKPGSQMIELTHPQADMTLSDGAWMMLGASQGLYRQDKSELDLMGSISLYHDQGYEVHTERATLLLREGIARGDAPIKGQGTFGALEGEGFEVDQKQRILKITGKSRLVLRSAGADKAPEPSPQPARRRRKRGTGKQAQQRQGRNDDRTHSTQPVGIGGLVVGCPWIGCPWAWGGDGLCRRNGYDRQRRRPDRGFGR